MTRPDGERERERFDVFLSYNHRDGEVVEQIAAALTANGLEPWFDRWCLTPGGPWQDELSAGLERSGSCAVVLGPHDIGGWGRIETAVALDLMSRDPGFRVFAVLLPGLDAFDPNTLPLLLRTRTWVDLRAGPGDAQAMRELLHAVKGLPFGPGVAVDPRPGVAPYRGLQAFEEEHAGIFFGREAETQRLVEQLRTSRFHAVVGPSGSGKSSLVRAGLVPALRAGALAGSECWDVRVVRPGARPLAVLAAQLVDLRGAGAMAQTLDEMADDPRGLHLAVELALAREPPEARVLLVVDQLEEVFTLCRSESERGAMLDNLVHATTIPGGRTVAVVTMRADWYPRLAEYPRVAQLVQAHQALVGALDESRLRRVVTEPASVVGIDLQAGLVDTILDDVRDQPGSLPLLEHALLETWERRVGTTMTLDGYRGSGGVRGALAARAEQVFTQLDPSERQIARRVLLRLTQPGEGTEDTRRRVAMTELLSSERDPDAVRDVTTRLTGARLLTSTADADALTWIDVSHEALIRGWPRLQGWIDEERDSLRAQRKLTADAQEWEQSSRDRSLLPRGRSLAVVLDWRRSKGPALSELERSFLSAAVRMRRLRRAVVAAAGVALLYAIVLVSLPRVEEYRLAQRAKDLGPTASFPESTALLGGGGTDGRAVKRSVRVDAFELDRHEVSNEQYRLCVRARRCSEPSVPITAHRSFAELDDRLPVRWISARQAAIFCRWIGRRLPTEAEWERAARGTHGASWPWGEAPATRARANNDSGGQAPALAPVDDSSFAAGASKEGVLNLVGNVAEYTSTPQRCRPDPYHCTTRWDERSRSVPLATRGTSFQETAVAPNGSDMVAIDPNEPLESNLGVRCAKSAD